MAQLSASLIDEYFNVHLPYRTRAMVAHYRMSRPGWNGDAGQLEACFIAGLVIGRQFINALGIGKSGGTVGVYSPHNDDVLVTDLGGTAVDVNTLRSAEKDMLYGFIVMADKAAAHFTLPNGHDLKHYDEGMPWLCKQLETHLYKDTGRAVGVDIAAVLTGLP